MARARAREGKGNGKGKGNGNGKGNGMARVVAKDNVRTRKHVLEQMSSITAVSPADIETLLSVCRLELGTANAPDGTAIANNRWDGLLATAIEHGLVGQLQKTASTTESIPVSSLRLNRNCLSRASNAQLPVNGHPV